LLVPASTVSKGGGGHSKLGTPKSGGPPAATGTPTTKRGSPRCPNPPVLIEPAGCPKPKL
jgi:hypothetical protein